MLLIIIIPAKNYFNIIVGLYRMSNRCCNKQALSIVSLYGESRIGVPGNADHFREDLSHETVSGIHFAACGDAVRGFDCFRINKSLTSLVN